MEHHEEFDITEVFDDLQGCQSGGMSPANQNILTKSREALIEAQIDQPALSKWIKLLAGLRNKHGTISPSNWASLDGPPANIIKDPLRNLFDTNGVCFVISKKDSKAPVQIFLPGEELPEKDSNLIFALIEPKSGVDAASSSASQKDSKPARQNPESTKPKVTKSTKISHNPSLESALSRATRVVDEEIEREVSRALEQGDIAMRPPPPERLKRIREKMEDEENSRKAAKSRTSEKPGLISLADLLEQFTLTNHMDIPASMLDKVVCPADLATKIAAETTRGDSGEVTEGTDIALFAHLFGVSSARTLEDVRAWGHSLGIHTEVGTPLIFPDLSEGLWADVSAFETFIDVEDPENPVYLIPPTAAIRAISETRLTTWILNNVPKVTPQKNVEILEKEKATAMARRLAEEEMMELKDGSMTRDVMRSRKIELQKEWAEFRENDLPQPRYVQNLNRVVNKEGKLPFHDHSKVQSATMSAPFGYQNPNNWETLKTSLKIFLGSMTMTKLISAKIAKEWFDKITSFEYDITAPNLTGFHSQEAWRMHTHAWGVAAKKSAISIPKTADPLLRDLLDNQNAWNIASINAQRSLKQGTSNKKPLGKSKGKGLSGKKSLPPKKQKQNPIGIICKKWLMGICPFSAKDCRFSHKPKPRSPFFPIFFARPVLLQNLIPKKEEKGKGRGKGRAPKVGKEKAKGGGKEKEKGNRAPRRNKHRPLPHNRGIHRR